MSDATTPSGHVESAVDTLRKPFHHVGRLLHAAPWLIYVVVLIVGLLLFWSAFAPATFSGSVTDSVTRGNVRLSQNSFWQAALLLAFATTLVTVSAFEILKLGLEALRAYIETLVTFNRFWGDHASTRGSDGVILVQEENIEEAVSALGGTVSFSDPKVGSNYNRFHKARTWINRWDAEGAKYIRAEFWKLGYAPPEMQHTSKSRPYVVLPTAPFVVSVGLFSEETKAFIRDYSGRSDLIRVVQSDKGDAIELYRTLVADSESLETTGQEMLRVTPRRWDRQAWIRNEATTDFGIIMRHTVVRADDSRLVRFVVAGFTEQGTEAAAKYLSREWRRLHERFWRTPRAFGQPGDFFIVVVGKSTETDGWTLEPGINPITPQRMAETHRSLAPRANP